MPDKKENRRAAWVVGVAALIVALVWAGTNWGQQLFGILENSGKPANQTLAGSHTLLELFKLVAAGVIGLVVTAVHKRSHPDKPLSRSVAHAQILFCVAGALTIIIIGDSLPRAFGAVGVASIIRFRTPLKDQKDAAVLFLLVGLGMACGGGVFAVAGLGALFVCIFLLVLNRVGGEQGKPRYMTVELVAEGREFPSAHVQSVFTRSRIGFEPREVSQGKEAVVKYHVALDPDLSLDELNTKLLDGGASGIKSVEWEPAKKKG